MKSSKTSYISLNGKLTKNAMISVKDHAVLLGDGLFETLKVTRGKLDYFSEHYKRLQQGAKILSLPLPSERALKQQSIALIKKNKLLNARLRITITRGIGPSGLSTHCKNQSIIITAEEISAPLSHAKVITTSIDRAVPGIKSLSYLPNVLAKKEAEKKKAHEAIFVDHGYIREGSISNVFMIKKKVLYTPQNKILKGITRERVLKAAKKLRIKTKVSDITLNRFLFCDEAFLTSSTQGIIPITQINDKKKKIGLLTKRLQDEIN